MCIKAWCPENNFCTAGFFKVFFEGLVFDPCKRFRALSQSESVMSRRCEEVPIEAEGAAEI